MKSPRWSWLPDSGLTVRCNEVQDFYGKSNHDYEIVMANKEIVALLSRLASCAQQQPREFEKVLSGALKPVLQIAATLSGITFASIRAPEQQGEDKL